MKRLKRYIKVPIKTNKTGRFCDITCHRTVMVGRIVCEIYEEELKPGAHGICRCQQCIDAEVKEADNG